MKALNIGCGSRFHPDWTNLDLAPADPSIQAHDARQELPFGDDTFELVYHSHVLEHLTRRDGVAFLKECRRVLKPEGVLRVALPDLETIAREYLKALESALAGDASAAANHEWMTLELLDQSARYQSCGAILEYLSAPDLNNEDFVIERCGEEARLMLRELRKKRKATPTQKRTLWNRAIRFLSTPSLWKELLIKRLLGADYRNLEIGRFRQSGEVHLSMYDRFSLVSQLKTCGFEHITEQSATSSCAPNWNDFQLDADANGNAYKPDSLFMEAVKPPGSNRN
jgi:predicted SAM-dependent methyltransferase